MTIDVPDEFEKAYQVGAISEALSRLGVPIPDRVVANTAQSLNLLVSGKELGISNSAQPRWIEDEHLGDLTSVLKVKVEGYELQGYQLANSIDALYW